jgi:hypothetical protein
MRRDLQKDWYMMLQCPVLASQTPAVLSGEPIDGKQLLHDAVMNTAFRIMHLSGRGETEARYEKPGFEPKPQAEQLSDGTTPSDVIPSFDPTKVTPEMKNKVLLLKDMVEEHNNTTDLKKKQALETQIEIVSQPDAPIEKTADGDIVVDGMEDLLAEVDFTDEGLGVSAPVAPDKQINGNRENSKLKDAPVEIDALATKIVNGVKNFTPEELQLQQNESKNLEKAITKAAQKKVTSIESKKLEKIEELNKIKKFGDNVGDAMNNLLDNAKREVVSKGIPENNNTDTAQFLFTPEEQEAIDLMNKHFETEDFKENTNISERIKYEENFLNERKNKVSKKYGLKQEVATTKEKPLPAPSELPPIDEKKIEQKPESKIQNEKSSTQVNIPKESSKPFMDMANSTPHS